MDDTKVQSENDNPQDFRSGHEFESKSTVPDRLPESPPLENQIGPCSERPHRRKGMTGGYYWFPTPGTGGISWSVITCRDLHCNPDAGHDAELWPKLIVRLAATWGKDAQALKRRLDLSYTGLPRGRVTRPDKTFLVLHGKDSPAQMWEAMVIEAFRLPGREVKFIFDEHETQLPGHSQAVESSLGRRLLMNRREDRDEL
jgi:hypothetical protein